MTIDEALRHVLTKAGFFLPGEAQKIDRITTVRHERTSPSFGPSHGRSCRTCPERRDSHGCCGRG